MREFLKNEILESFRTIYEAHDELKKYMEKKDFGRMEIILADLQDMAVQIGNAIERSEGEGFVSIKYLEEYCETVYEVSQSAGDEHNRNRAYKALNKKLIRAENSVKADIRVKKEVVFISYKAAMWDSLESVWRNSAIDPCCDAYVIAIPYYDLNPDHSFGRFHYEGDQYPDDVPITHYEAYDLAARKPDIIYFNNPYDDWNLVTSVEPMFYSSNLKKYTKCLVYIPYYVTSGSMSEGQRFCPAYMNADYIVIQSPEFRAYFDERIPDKKFLPFGSPKFDRVIKKCQNPPEPPKEWAEKINGRKVYFYNTSISGMLTDTESFLKKMEYVFKCFEGREDACLLWRPHPLLESTFDSMRPQYRPVFEALKRKFIQNSLGIYDTTADVEDTIALCDAYIGDAGSSVTSLFGLVGKPIFILNNKIHSKPDEESWRGEIIKVDLWGNGNFIIAQRNKLYKSSEGQYHYKYLCDLSDCTFNGGLLEAYEIEGKTYICPVNSHEIIVIGHNGFEKKIELKKAEKEEIAVSISWRYRQYLILVSSKNFLVIRYDTSTEKVVYFNNIDMLVKNDQGQIVICGSWVYRDCLYIASSTDNTVCRLNIESGEKCEVKLPIQSRCGCSFLVNYQEELWFLPYKGKVIVRWNPLTDEVQEYTDFPKGFRGVNPVTGLECEGYLFGTPAFYGEYMYLPALWANMYLKLNINTGEITQWHPPFEDGEGKEYFFSMTKSNFLWKKSEGTDAEFEIYSEPGRKLYRVNLDTDACREVEIQFDKEELKKNEPGFGKYSKSLRYACIENSFNSLEDFLDGKTTGSQFSRENQIMAYSAIAANYNGGCGEMVHKFVMKEDYKQTELSKNER